MSDSEILKALKIDLGLTSNAYNERLEQYISSAKKEIEAEGVTLDLNNIDHIQTVTMYAGWQWRKRDTGEGMPRMVRYQLNQLIFHQHLEDKN